MRNRLRAIPPTLFLLAACGDADPKARGAGDGGGDGGGARPPNVVVVLADDLGWGDLSVQGSRTIETPALDQLAAEGLRFTQAYSGSTVCTPARAALLTGRAVPRLSLPGTSFGVYLSDSEGGLDPGEQTLAELLRDAGYRTGLVGKWHLGKGDDVSPQAQGFDRFFGLPYSNDLLPLPLLDDGVMIDDVSGLDRQASLSERFTAEALSFVRDAAARDVPFFLFYPTPLPHVPLTPGPEFEGRAPRCADVSAPRACGAYADVVAELDASVGKLLAELDALGVAEDTLVVFTSDNGPWLFQGEDSGSAGPLRSGKGSTFEGGFRVPLLVRPPGPRAGRVVDAPVTFLDLFSTVVSVTGAPSPTRPTDGRDLTALLDGGEPPPGEFTYLYTRRDNQTAGALRRGRYKYKAAVTAPESPELPELHGPLLFDLDADPAEASDLTADQPELAAELATELERLSGAVSGAAP
ncbi:MAG: sulfatase-like hydrolase/transferase [Deltaproteobacteria bacterium]|nr:sulfatase-like hydrolase/transferase [Deltaproteobacteria bacterium]